MGERANGVDPGQIEREIAMLRRDMEPAMTELDTRRHAAADKVRSGARRAATFAGIMTALTVLSRIRNAVRHRH
jgi:hypothetical protein